jgi:hypothetical protein
VRTVLTAFVLGVAAVGIVAAVAAFTLGVAAQSSGWGSFDVALGPVTFLAFQRTAGGTATTIGMGIGVLALAGGLGNAAGARFLARRRPR